MFNKKLEKRIEKLEVVIAGLDKLKEDIKKLNDKKPMYKIGEHLKYYCGNDFLTGFSYMQDDLIPANDVIKLILDKMNLEVKSEPAQQEKFVLVKKEGNK